MAQITARLPDDLVKSLDAAARSLKRTRAELVRQAIEHYLEDYEDLARTIDRLRDPMDPVLDWEDVRRELLRQD
ncbi:MAG: ribbon-helix-helix protein, CopG family [Acidiferrobacterales bacterium]